MRKYYVYTYLVVLVLFQMFFVNGFCEDAVKDVYAEFITSEHVTIYLFGRDLSRVFSLDTGIVARMPRPCEKPIKISTEEPLLVSIGRRPEAGLKTLLDSLAPFRVEGVSFHYSVTSEEITLVASLVGLRILAFENQIFDETHCASLSEIKNLQELEFTRCEFSSPEALKFVSAISDLKGLSLNKCKNFSSSVPEISKLGKLLSLTLIGDELTDEALPDLKNLRFLRELKISSNSISDEGMKFIGNLGRLNKISIQGSKLTGRCITYISSFHYITDIELIDLEEIDEYISFPEYNSIQCLSLVRTDISDIGLKSIEKHLDFQELILIDNQKVTESGYNNFIHSPGAKRLFFNPSFSNRPVNIPLGIRSTTHLRIRCREIIYCPLFFNNGGSVTNLRLNGSLHDATLQSMLDCFRGITELELVDSSLTDSSNDCALSQLSRSQILKRLRISQIEAKSDRWIGELKALLNLEYLSLNSVSCISDTTIENFVRFKSLRELDLRGNPDLTSSGVKKLSSMENLICFNPTPYELIIEHQNAVTSLFQRFKEVMNDEMHRHGGYYRNGVKAIPQVKLDTRDGRFGYSFRYFSNSNNDDASKYVLFAFPNSLSEGEKAFIQTESGFTYEYEVKGKNDIEFFKQLNSKKIDFNENSSQRIPSKTFSQIGG